MQNVQQQAAVMHDTIARHEAFQKYDYANL